MLPLSATGTDFSSFCTEEQFGCIGMTVRFIIWLFINSIVYLKRGNYKKNIISLFLIVIIIHVFIKQEMIF